MSHEKIASMDDFPKQGSYLGRRVRVCFNYDTDHTIAGEIVRDDAAGLTIIKLDTGLYVLGTECQYTDD